MVSIPIIDPFNILNLNSTILEQLSNMGIDPYDPESPFYNDICTSFHDDNSDYPLADRRKDFFKNVSLLCVTNGEANCTYSKIEPSQNTTMNRLVCDCVPANKNEISPGLVDYILQPLITANFEIFKCIVVVLENTAELRTNYGIILYSLIMTLFFLTLILNRFRDYAKYIHYYLDQILEVDCKMINFNVLEFQKEENKQDRVAIVNEVGMGNNSPTIVKVKNNETFPHPKTVCSPHRKTTGINMKVVPEAKIELESLDIANFSNNELENVPPIKLFMKKASEEFSNLRASKLVSTNNFVLKPEGVDTDQKDTSICHNRQLILLDDNTIENQKTKSSLYKRKISDSKTTLNKANTHIDKFDFTEKDYEAMNFEQLHKYDKRGFCEYYCWLIKAEHIILSIFMRKTLLISEFSRMAILLCSISLDFSLNAFFYSDDFISKNRKINSTNNGKNNFISNILNELPKSLWSLLISGFTMNLLCLLLDPPKEYEDNLNNALKTRKQDKVLIAYQEYSNNMRCRTVSFFMLSGSVIVFCVLYTLTFCGVYTKSQTGWLIAGILSFVIGTFGFDLLIPLIESTNRIISLKLNLELKFVYYITKFLKCFQG